MGTGYTRNDSANNIADGNVINASDLDGEFDAVQAAFNGTTGHSHDGTTGEGPQIATGGLADNAVTTAKITDANVTLAKMAANSVDSDQYVDGSIDRVHLAADIVDGTKIADDSINSEHYVDGSIDTAHIGNLQVTNAKIAADAIDGTKLADNAVDSEHYTDGSIDRVHLAADIIDGSKIANDVINSEHYVAGSIDAEHLASSSVTAAKVANDAVALGTKTTGNYVATITAGTGITGSSSSEGGTPTIALATAGAGAATYGSTDDGTKIDTITLDAYGRVTAVATGATMDRWVLEDGDGTEVTITNDKEVKFVEGGGVDINWTDTSTGSDGDPYDLTFTVNTSVTAGNGLTGGGQLNASRTLNVGAGTGISVSADAVALATAGAGAGTYGSTSDGTKIDQITLDAYGRVTAVTTGSTGSTSNVGDITGVTAGSGLSGGGTSGTVTVSHADTSSQASVNNSGTTFIQDVTLDTYGHVTGLTSATVAAGGAAPTSTVFTSSGTWSKPTDCKGIKVTVVGGGGAGGSIRGQSSATTSGCSGGGGGAGGVAIEYINVANVNSVSVTVGAGGTAANAVRNAPAFANSGGTSSFGNYCSASGGGGGHQFESYGGANFAYGRPGGGGTGTGGTINSKGENGGNSYAVPQLDTQPAPGTNNQQFAHSPDGGGTILGANGGAGKFQQYYGSGSQGPTNGGQPGNAGTLGGGGSGAVCHGGAFPFPNFTVVGGAGGSGIVFVEQFF